MKKKVCVLTATRAEYGLLKPVIRELRIDETLDVRVVATGAHLSPEFGLTYQEIEQDGIPIDRKIEILLSSDTPNAISKSMGLALLGFADYFAELQPDLLVVLGDRYETLAVCCAAMNQRIPIAHLYGGETSEGAIDEACRHAITKLSHLHFTSTEQYRKRVIQLGENPSRVYNVGALGVENILKEILPSKDELEKSLNYQLGSKYVVVTYHPVTLESESSDVAFKALLEALDTFPELRIVFTKANADVDGRIINELIDAYVSNHPNAIAVASLGTKRYLAAVKYSVAVIGNSSSGIIEVPSLHVPTVNIGDRQKGRLMSDSVINCISTVEDIRNALRQVLSSESREKIKMSANPYEGGDVSSRIVLVLKEFLSSDDIILKKVFYNIM
jgi:GDP/UDP-N,N'-diacetylbacillosamine 2-epimerase (hydrolysing)